MIFFVHHKATSHRLYQIKLGILHITITILQSKGIHFQVALGTDPTFTLPGIELTAGLTTWNRKEHQHALAPHTQIPSSSSPSRR